MSAKFQHQLEPWAQLADKIVMVTGASSSLGLEFCLDLAAAGCRIVAVARRIDRLESLCHQINKVDGLFGGVKNGDSCRAKAVELDVTADGPIIEAAVEKAWSAFGQVDVLINNAGVTGPKGSSLELSEEEWNNVLKINLTGSWMVSKHVGSKMRAAGRGGSIINISSVAGLNRVHHIGGVAYSSSKVALNTVTNIMALELGEHNIRVNVIAPGLFKSEITEQLMVQKWLQNVAERTIPLRTFGRSDPALTSLVRYLIHDSSAYVSGNVFIVDAGYTLPSFPIFSSL